MIIPGMVSATFRGETPERIIELCREAGLKAVEWSENAHVNPDDPKGAAALYEKTKAAGLDVAAYGSYYRLGEQQDPEEVFARSLRSAAALRAPVIRIWAGAKPSDQVTKQERKALAKEAALVGEMAEKEGIKIGFEWHKNTLTDTNESAMELLKQADQKNLYCLWQPTVALTMDQRVEGLDLLGDRLLNLHVYYWLEGKRRPFQEGLDEWARYLAHVDQNTDRYGLLEFVMDNTEEQFLEDAKALHGLLRKLGLGG